MTSMEGRRALDDLVARHPARPPIHRGRKLNLLGETPAQQARSLAAFDERRKAASFRSSDGGESLNMSARLRTTVADSPDSGTASDASAASEDDELNALLNPHFTEAQLAAIQQERAEMERENIAQSEPARLYMERLRADLKATGGLSALRRKYSISNETDEELAQAPEEEVEEEEDEAVFDQEPTATPTNEGSEETEPASESEGTPTQPNDGTFVVPSSGSKANERPPRSFTPRCNSTMLTMPLAQVLGSQSDEAEPSPPISPIQRFHNPLKAGRRGSLRGEPAGRDSPRRDTLRRVAMMRRSSCVSRPALPGHAANPASPAPTMEQTAARVARLGTPTALRMNLITAAPPMSGTGRKVPAAHPSTRLRKSVRLTQPQFDEEEEDARDDSATERSRRSEVTEAAQEPIVESPLQPDSKVSGSAEASTNQSHQATTAEEEEEDVAEGEESADGEAMEEEDEDELLRAAMQMDSDSPQSVANNSILTTTAADWNMSGYGVIPVQRTAASPSMQRSAGTSGVFAVPANPASPDVPEDTEETMASHSASPAVPGRRPSLFSGRRLSSIFTDRGASRASLSVTALEGDASALGDSTLAPSSSTESVGVDSVTGRRCKVLAKPAIERRSQLDTPPGGLRRSKRNRLPTLHHYLGQKPIYEHTPNGQNFRLVGVSDVKIHDPVCLRMNNGDFEQATAQELHIRATRKGKRGKK